MGNFSQDGGLMSLLMLLLTPFTVLWSMISSFFGGASSSGSSSTSSGSSSSSSGPRGTSSTHRVTREAGIGRLRSSDFSDDDMNTWNGNSTQQQWRGSFDYENCIVNFSMFIIICDRLFINYLANRIKSSRRIILGIMFTYYWNFQTSWPNHRVGMRVSWAPPPWLHWGGWTSLRWPRSRWILAFDWLM